MAHAHTYKDICLEACLNGIEAVKQMRPVPGIATLQRAAGECILRGRPLAAEQLFELAVKPPKHREPQPGITKGYRVQFDPTCGRLYLRNPVPLWTGYKRGDIVPVEFRETQVLWRCGGVDAG